MKHRTSKVTDLEDDLFYIPDWLLYGLMLSILRGAFFFPEIKSTIFNWHCISSLYILIQIKCFMSCAMLKSCKLFAECFCLFGSSEWNLVVNGQSFSFVINLSYTQYWVTAIACSTSLNLIIFFVSFDKHGYGT